MTPTENGHTEQALADYLAVIRRYMWTIVMIAVVVPVSAYIVSSRQTKVYSATSKVLLSRQNLGSALTGVPNADSNTDPDRFAQTQAEIARTPEVAAKAIKRAGITGMFPYELLDNTSVSPETNADVLRFTITNGSPLVAVRLTTAYAEAFAANKYEMDTTSLAAARKELEARVTQLPRH